MISVYKFIDFALSRLETLPSNQGCKTCLRTLSTSLTLKSRHRLLAPNAVFLNFRGEAEQNIGGAMAPLAPPSTALTDHLAKSRTYDSTNLSIRFIL